MDLARKVAIVVSLQVVLIVASFLAIMYFESQTVLTGNAVNVAGKNRLLASAVQNEMSRVLFHGTAGGGEVLGSLDRLGENIDFLRHGGSVSGVDIPPLSPRFEGSWGDVADSFGRYEESASALLASGEGFSTADVEEFERIGDELIALSDVLAEGLGHDVEELSGQLILLQAVLGAANVAIHVLMMVFLWRIFGAHTARMVRAEKFSTIGEFASVMAHDMRNPLGSIRNSVRIIQGGSAPQSVADGELRRINRSVRRMSHQIEGVLNYVRDAPLALEQARVSEVLARALETVDVPPSVELSLPGDGGATVRCDAEKLEFVFANLLLNAVQAIGGAGRIAVRMRDGGDGAVALEFENSGSGIPEGDAARVFEPLFTTKMQGTGLGLTSCRNIVERHGGTITVSGGDGPVTFTVRLPRDGPTRGRESSSARGAGNVHGTPSDGLGC